MNMPNNMQLRTDSTSMQQSLAFMQSNASYIERQVYKRRYADLDYSTVIPIDTSIPEWAKSVTYYASDTTGKADWLARGADDMPTVGQSMQQYNVSVETAGVGYRYDLFEIQYAMAMGISLTADRAMAARRAAEEMIDRIAYNGDADRGIYGLINQPNVTVLPASSVTPDGGSATTSFAAKTGQQVLKDINSMLTSSYLATKTIELADTLIVPYTTLVLLNETFMSETNPTMNGTVMDYVRRNNIYTQTTGRPLFIKGSLHLDTAGEGGTARIISYRRDPDVLKMYMPMPFRFFPVWQDGPMRFLVPGAFRIGGVDVKLPGAFRYMDGV